MVETCCDSNHCYGKCGMNMSEGTFVLQRVKTSSMFLRVSKCWYEVPEAQIAGNWRRTFWKIFSQPFQLSEENVKPGPAGHSATIILCSQTAGTLTIQWHPLFWAELFHTESQLPKYALITMWKDHQYPFLWSWNTCDSRLRQAPASVKPGLWTGWRLPCNWDRVQHCGYWERAWSCMFGTLQPGSSLSHFSTCVLNIIKNPQANKLKSLAVSL